MAKERAEAPEYDASFDSAFVDKPAYEEGFAIGRGV